MEGSLSATTDNEEDDPLKLKSVTLILNGERFEVCKAKLATESLYFGSLFSHNFRDSNLSEHQVNYDFATSAFKDFVDWIHEEYTSLNTHGHNQHPIKPCLIKHTTMAVEGILKLLRISVIYATDKLTHDIIDIIVLNHYTSKTMSLVWVTAQELGLKVLQDICKAAFLDRGWDITVLHQSLLSFDRQSLENTCNGMAKIPCVAGYKKCTDTIRKPSVYYWTGTALSELVEVKVMYTNSHGIQTQKDGLIGMLLIGAGFSIYAIGGEQGFETGRFNNYIWRYCIISKKWYCLARLPVSRRHMAAAIIGNKLVVAGGVGRLRLKLSTVDVLHLDTSDDSMNEQWTSAAEVPETFTEPPLHCAANGKLFLLKSLLHVYCPTADQWTSFRLDPQSVSIIYMSAVPTITVHKDGIYLCSDCCESPLFKFDSTFTKLQRVYSSSTCPHKHELVISDGINLLSISLIEDVAIVEQFQESAEQEHKVLYEAKRPDIYALKPTMGHFSLTNPKILDM